MPYEEWQGVGRLKGFMAPTMPASAPLAPPGHLAAQERKAKPPPAAAPPAMAIIPPEPIIEVGSST